MRSRAQQLRYFGWTDLDKATCYCFRWKACIGFWGPMNSFGIVGDAPQIPPLTIRKRVHNSNKTVTVENLMPKWKNALLQKQALFYPVGWGNNHTDTDQCKNC